MRSVIVTGANEAFMPLLRGLILSLQQWQPAPFTAIACLDLGLSPSSRSWIDGQVTHVAEPGWDVPVAAALREAAPHLRALTCRPFLPRYFPGYDVYVWIDADAWVQERFALDWLIALAERGVMAVVPEVDRAYRIDASILQWHAVRMQRCFGVEAAQQSLWRPHFNAGVFALQENAPHWRAWADDFHVGLTNASGLLCCDQTALNRMLWTERHPVNPLPALCNWLCHLALPRVDIPSGKLCEPFAPNNILGIVHLAGLFKAPGLQVDVDGAVRASGLRFPGA